MPHKIGLAAAFALTLVFAASLSGGSSAVQAGAIAAPAVALSVYAAMPAPKAPFDETPITPVESAGASMVN